MKLIAVFEPIARFDIVAPLIDGGVVSTANVALGLSGDSNLGPNPPHRREM
ncbi:hypothetical protein ACQP2T_59415 [Nonomuraea sp. CA-143628]|uniref:hypothetical protein n=1 Tax=Nonomuraea sp. CA-143628 TaxID=3239997 RepID=UPI003D91F6C0